MSFLLSRIYRKMIKFYKKNITQKLKYYMFILLFSDFINCSSRALEKNESLLLLLNLQSKNENNHNSFFFNAQNLFNRIIEAPGATYTDFKDPKKAINGIQGCGNNCGSLDVYSLQSSSSSSFCIPNQKCLVLETQDKKIKNVSGVDFIVFENPFCIGSCATSRFMEPVVVEVSANGTQWCGWNPMFTGDSNSQSDLKDPQKWLRFAGIHPVLFNQTNWTYSQDDIFDFNKSGGDHFDLDDANFGNSGTGCDSNTKNDIQSNGFIYLRLTSANSRSFTYPSDSFDQTADIDGAIAREVINR